MYACWYRAYICFIHIGLRLVVTCQSLGKNRVSRALRDPPLDPTVGESPHVSPVHLSSMGHCSHS